MKCCMMQHFIRVFIDCKIISLKDSSIQRVKLPCQNLFLTLKHQEDHQYPQHLSPLLPESLTLPESLPCSKASRRSSISPASEPPAAPSSSLDSVMMSLPSAAVLKPESLDFLTRFSTGLVAVKK